MTERPFSTCDEWLRTLERIFTAPGAEPELRRRALDIDTVVGVARMEARHADAQGQTLVSHERLAELTGLPRKTVATVRLALIDAGLQSLSAQRTGSVSIVRILQSR